MANDPKPNGKARSRPNTTSSSCVPSLMRCWCREWKSLIAMAVIVPILLSVHLIFVILPSQLVYHTDFSLQLPVELQCLFGSCIDIERRPNLVVDLSEAVYPLLVMGMPKVGTTSIQKFFQCNGLTASHYNCNAPGKEKQVCGSTIRENVLQGSPPLEGLVDDFQVFAEMDHITRDDCYVPQIQALDEIHAHYPNATFILNTRNAKNWLKSIKHWNNMDKRLRWCNLPGFPSAVAGEESTGLPEGVGDSDADLLTFFKDHNNRIRNFVSTHPSHALIEIDVDAPEAGDVLSAAFGGNAHCWANANNKGKSPILVMGMPKSGTTSINEFFQCNGLTASHQFCGSVGFCGLAIRDNLQHQLAPLHGFDEQFDVFTQLDTNDPPSKCYYPQIQALEEIH
eukprot:scaffold42005_cov40-Attheya_sp.AAC.1